MSENTTQEGSKKVSLKVLRSSLALTQKELAEKAHLHERTITAMERGQRPVRLTSAFSVLNVLNAVLLERNRPQVTVKDVDWTILEQSELEAM